jgi:hypothetical protein
MSLEELSNEKLRAQMDRHRKLANRHIDAAADHLAKGNTAGFERRAKRALPWVNKEIQERKELIKRGQSVQEQSIVQFPRKPNNNNRRPR